MNQPQTILDCLERHSNKQANRTAITFLESDDDQRSISFEVLKQRAIAIARTLLTHAVPGDRALMTYPAGLDFIEAFLGCLYAGVIPVPAYPPKKNRNIERLLAIARDCQPRLLLCTAQEHAHLDGDFAAAISGAIALPTDRIPLTAGPQVRLPSIDANQVAFIQYTAGSTASPKGVVISHRNIVANESLIQKYFEFDHSSIMISWLPMFHDMGLIGGVLAPIFVGFPSILMAPTRFMRTPIEWLKTVTQYRGTVTGAPNFAYDYCVNKITENDKKLLDLSSLKIAFNGAEPVRATTLAQFSEAFRDCGFRHEAFFPCYGLAEATLLVSGGPLLTPARVVSVDPEALEQHHVKDITDGLSIVGCGQVSGDLEVRIVDPETGQACEQDRVGELWIQGASVGGGYFGCAEETHAVFSGKLADNPQTWMRSGDYGFLRNGELFITGRRKDLIIIRGRNIYPQDVEQVVYDCLTLDSANSVAAVQASHHGFSSVAVIVEATRSIYHLSKRWKSRCDEESDAEIQAFRNSIWQLKQRVSQHFDVAISHIAFVKPGHFPRASSGKVMRSRCQQDFFLGRAEYLDLPMSSLGPYEHSET